MKNFISSNWIKQFPKHLKIGMAMMMLFLFACADKNDLSGPTLEEVYAENRETSNCDFYLCDFPFVAWTPVIGETLFIRNCPVIVSYEWRKCDKGFEIQNFNFTPTSDPGCKAIMDSIATFWIAGQSLFANEMYNDWYRTITIAVQNTILESFSSTDFPPGNSFSYQFIETDCHTLCIDASLDEYDNISISYFNHVKCGESCCVRVGQFRFDQNGDPFIIGQGIVEGTECDPTTVWCSGEYDDEVCSPACDRL